LKEEKGILSPMKKDFFQESMRERGKTLSKEEMITCEWRVKVSTIPNLLLLIPARFERIDKIFPICRN
jgi:hypothetical protein